MARAKKAKPADSRMAFDFGDAPVRVQISELEPAEVPIARSEGGVERIIREETPTSHDDARIDTGRVSSIEVDHAPDCACEACVALRVEVEKVLPRDGGPAASRTGKTIASTDMSERSSTSGKQVGPNVMRLIHAAEDARREATISALVEAAEIALVRGKSREIHDMIITELRRRYRDSAERIAYHLQLKGLA